jgi:hypothetical protein
VRGRVVLGSPDAASCIVEAPRGVHHSFTIQ